MASGIRCVPVSRCSPPRRSCQRRTSARAAERRGDRLRVGGLASADRRDRGPASGASRLSAVPLAITLARCSDLRSGVPLRRQRPILRAFGGAVGAEAGRQWCDLLEAVLHGDVAGPVFHQPPSISR